MVMKACGTQHVKEDLLIDLVNGLFIELRDMKVSSKEGGNVTQ